MTAPLIPRTYAEWRHCITVLCAIPLTSDYIAERLKAFDDESDFMTQKYRQVWGEKQLQQTRQWFVQAQQELSE
jgi:hypothetical protein